MNIQKNTYRLLLVALLVLTSFGIGFAAASSNFSDVSEDDWYYGGVTTLTDYGLLQGYDDGTFRGSNDVNRAEIAVMMARMVDLVKNSCVDTESGKIYFEGDGWENGEDIYECIDGSAQVVGVID